MGYHLYCIAPRGHRPPAGLEGVDGAPVTALDAGSLTAWTSELPARPAPSVERAKQHHAVVEAAQVDGVVPLPVRFGEWAARADLERSLGDDESKHLESLARVAGSAEFGVRVGAPDAAPARDVQVRSHPSAAGKRVSTGGRAYLEAAAARIAVERRAAECVEPGVLAIRQAVADLVRAELVEDTRGGLGGVLHLVPRENWELYRLRVGEVPVRLTELHFMLSGPWPPYSFVA